MRLFLLWPDYYPEPEKIIRELEKRSHDVVYYVGPDPQGKQVSPKTIFHYHYDALHGIPAPGVTVSGFAPPGEDLIKQLSHVESIILTMMNKRYDWMCVDERRHLYYSLLQYWYGVLQTYKPDVLVFKTIPHTVYDYLLYELAYIFGIKTVIFWNSFIADRLFLYNDFRRGDDVLRQRMVENKNKNFSLEDLSEITRAYYLKQTGKETDATPAYLKEDRKNFSLFNIARIKLKVIVRSILDLSVFERTFAYLLKVFKPNIKDEYESVESEVDFKKPFVYLPLHFQPEATSSPVGGIFVDQILMVEIISASLPGEWLLYVKEHPSQWLPRGFNFFSARYRGYYRKIAALKNVRLIPIKTDTYDLINKSQAVATISGVAGLEALMRLKPAVIFGYPWYRDFPGAFKVNDTKSCRAALQKIREGFKSNTQGIINFLKSVDEAGIQGYIDNFGKKDSQLTEEENLRSIVDAINKRSLGL